MTWHRLLAGDALPVGAVVEGDFQGEDLLLWRMDNGACAAISAYCPHTRNYIPNGLAPGIPLANLLLGNQLTCPFHGWRFDNNGICTRIPPGQVTPGKVARGEPITPAWELREQNGWIEINAALT